MTASGAMGSMRRARAAFVLATLGCGGESPCPIPGSISPEWQQVLRDLCAASPPPLPAPNDHAAWQEIRSRRQGQSRADVDRALARWSPTLGERTLGGLRALEIVPRGHRADGRVVVHLHGGGYAFGSPRSALATSAGFADATGLRVLSLEYPLAPTAQWRTVVPAVAAAVAALAAEGTPMEQVALFGESAGGGLAAGAALALRDQGHALPAALVLWSPWSDVTETGDSYATLRDAEPSYRYDPDLRTLAAAYAAPADQKHPWVSPVYGDFAKPFPPTLIQGGTHELFLSNFVRLYQAIENGGGRATLDLYDGMPHMFPHFLPESAEARLALTKARRFLESHLRAASAR